MPVNENLVMVQGLKMYFPVLAGLLRRRVGFVKAIDGVTFNISKGETLGLVGESGCGKTTTGKCILQLYRPSGGRIIFDNTDLNALPPHKIRRIRERIQLISQDPYASLDPRQTAGEIIGEPLLNFGLARGKAYREKVHELLSMVELEARMEVK